MKKAFVSSLVAITLCSSFAFAAEPQSVRTSPNRKRPVKRVVPVSAQVSFLVLDAATKAPLINVQISLDRPGSEAILTNAQGVATMTKVDSGVAVATLNRGGYEPATRSINISAGTNQNTIELTPHPTATLVTTDGKSYQVDATAMEFGFVVPFVGGYTKTPKLDVCRNGTAVVYTKAEVKSINGPAVEADATNCCTFPKAQQVSITLKNGETFNAILRDSCTGYSIDVVTYRRDTGAPLYVPVKNLKSIDMP